MTTSPAVPILSSLFSLLVDKRGEQQPNRGVSEER